MISRAWRRRVVSCACSVVALASTAALVGCRSGDVLIGIEQASSTGDGDGGPAEPLDGGSLDAISNSLDAYFTDADLGPCLPDAGCPSGSVCEYPLDAAGCGLPGECFATSGLPIAQPGGALPSLAGLAAPAGLCGPLSSTPCLFFAPYSGFTPTRPSCDSGAEAADAGQDASDPH